MCCQCVYILTPDALACLPVRNSAIPPLHLCALPLCLNNGRLGCTSGAESPRGRGGGVFGSNFPGAPSVGTAVLHATNPPLAAVKQGIACLSMRTHALKFDLLRYIYARIERRYIGRVDGCEILLKEATATLVRRVFFREI